MKQCYRTVFRSSQGEITEKKSRFIATVSPAATENEALEFIESMRKRYWDARHNCYAFIIGENSSLSRFSDDGEPGGTAGRPMLEVLSGEGLSDICVVVTRYFGGTLLGTGGLVRAYQSAVKAGLKAGLIIEKIPALEYKITCDYAEVGKIQYLAGQLNLPSLNSEFTDEVRLTYLVPVNQEGQFLARLTEATGGRLQAEKIRELYYAVIEGEPVIYG